MQKLLQFFFGKPPQIFDKDGNVVHHFPDSKWKAWNDRYQSGPEYNWKTHTGMRAKDHRDSKKTHN